MTTYEALCKALVILEGSEALGESLLSPLRRMTQFQARYNPAVAGRCRWAVPATDGEGGSTQVIVEETMQEKAAVGGDGGEGGE